MAIKPVFIANANNQLITRVEMEFQYYSGFSDAQKKRSIQSLHQSFLKHYPEMKLLEISSHSPDEIGVKLSAFNLPVKLNSGREVSVECAYQAGKVFEHGGPYLDLLEGTSKGAKKDPRLKESGMIIAFEFEGERFPTYPRTCFYNWLYIKALNDHPEYGDALMEYDAFTDIAFNPKKSLNCQARAAAIYHTLRKANVLQKAMESTEAFIETIYYKR